MLLVISLKVFIQAMLSVYNLMSVMFTKCFEMFCEEPMCLFAIMILMFQAVIPVVGLIVCYIYCLIFCSPIGCSLRFSLIAYTPNNFRCRVKLF